MLLRSLIAIVLLLAPTPAQAAEPSATALQVGGERFSGQLTAIDNDGTLRFAGEQGERKLPLEELVRWGHPLPVRQSVTALGRPLVQVILADGGLLVGDLRRIDAENLTLISDLFDEIKLPLDQVRGLILQPPAGRHERDRLARQIEQAQQTADRLVLINGDELSGRLKSFEGDQFSLETDLGAVEVPSEKVAALVLNPLLVSKAEQSGRTTLVGFRDGSLLAAERLVMTPEQMGLQLAGNVILRTPATDSVVSLQPLGGKATYLSDLEPHSYRHVPFLTIEWPYARDRNVLGSRLAAADRLYSKGLGMHSAARLAYRLDRPYARFAAEIALDATAGRRGSVVFRVFTNSGDQWQQVYASPLLRGGDKPIPISVDLTDAQALILLVDYADAADTLDHANWLDARLEVQ